MKMKRVLAVSIALLSCSPILGKTEESTKKGSIDSVCSLSGATEYPKETAFAQNFANVVFWCPSKLPNQKIEVEGSLGKDGRIYNLKLLGNGQDPQSIAECFEALASAAPFVGVPDAKGKFFSIVSTFSDRRESFHKASEIEEFFVRNPAARKNSVLIHRIPVSVLKKFPETFKEGQIFSPGNLLAIKFNPEHLAISNGCFLDPISGYYSQWTDFFLKHPKATATEIEQEAQRICQECSLAG